MQHDIDASGGWPVTGWIQRRRRPAGPAQAGLGRALWHALLALPLLAGCAGLPKLPAEPPSFAIYLRYVLSLLTFVSGPIQRFEDFRDQERELGTRRLTAASLSPGATEKETSVVPSSTK